eukprot:scaffold180_cov134-Isochrysis_galbana.AAC.16
MARGSATVLAGETQLGYAPVRGTKVRCRGYLSVGVVRARAPDLKLCTRPMGSGAAARGRSPKSVDALIETVEIGMQHVEEAEHERRGVVKGERKASACTHLRGGPTPPVLARACEWERGVEGHAHPSCPLDSPLPPGPAGSERSRQGMSRAVSDALRHDCAHQAGAHTRHVVQALGWVWRAQR